ncbi:MAG: bifunctional riboflavin kinase/FAD synthetase [candidate division Zixibacteria bacterium]
MKTQFIRDIEKYAAENKSLAAASLGTFDGIHLGHKAIFQRVQAEAKANGLAPLLVTFHPHPGEVLTPENAPQLLTTIEEKEHFIPDFFSGKVIVIKFDEEIRNMAAEQFVKDILVEKLRVKKLIVGFDHALGKDRGGNSEELVRLSSKYGFEVEIVEPIMRNAKPVSSTRIREAMQSGNFEEATDLLGHQYAIFGTVMRGMGLGRKLGYPTANVDYNKRKLLPPEGVYSCWVIVKDEHYSGMMFIGKNHFDPNGGISVEANLFDFDEDIYDEEIYVYPTRFVRGNQKFDSKDELIAQMKRDREIVIEILKEEKSSGIEKRAQSSNYC